MIDIVENPMDFIFAIGSLLLFALGGISLVNAIHTNHIVFAIPGLLAFICSYLLGIAYSPHWFIYNLVIIVALLILIATINYLNFRFYSQPADDNKLMASSPAEYGSIV